MVKNRSFSFKGTRNPFYGKHHTKESIQKIKLSLKRRIPWNKGKKNPSRTYLNLINNLAKRPEVRKKISEAAKRRIM